MPLLDYGTPNTAWRQEARWSTCTRAVRQHFKKKWGSLRLNVQGLTLGDSRHNTDRRLWLHLPGSPLQASYALNTHDKPGGRICDNDAVCWAKSREESKRQITITVLFIWPGRSHSLRSLLKMAAEKKEMMNKTKMFHIKLEKQITSQKHFFFKRYPLLIWFGLLRIIYIFNVGKYFFSIYDNTGSLTPFGPLTMVNLSRRQTMHTCCWVSGTQSLRAGGWSGGWNLVAERRFLPAEFRSLSLSVLFEEGVCVGVLPINKHNRLNNNRNHK